MNIAFFFLFSYLLTAHSFRYSYGSASPHSKSLAQRRKFSTTDVIKPKSSKLKATEEPEDLEEVTKKYGLEYGVFKAFKTNAKPQELLAKYGAAYLATSISLAIVSYVTCYALVSNGIDMAALLSKIGIQVSDASSTAGTAGLAYIFHKAASPIRFPPTVALTPIVAQWIGKNPKADEIST